VNGGESCSMRAIRSYMRRNVVSSKPADLAGVYQVAPVVIAHQ
jgi:hypothetical protein